MSTATKYQHSIPDMWGGVECTINRIGDGFRDQLSYSGHYRRQEDIQSIAGLGITALRYPVLWEHHQPGKSSVINWHWASKQLETIRQSGMKPIAGLIHHGSGPAYTNLAQDDFADGLAAYALSVAKQFPWIDYYTPVNEPLTTARFSGLYGTWYPHHKSDRSFAIMLFNQLKAVVLSMQAIRTINPAAKLIQTEDLSKTYSTSSLHYQADFENERRWLTFDLLCGKVDRGHYLWNYFTRHLQIPESYLEFFMENSCAPDVMGLNYYITSERYLDDDISCYPCSTHGSNGKHSYADVEAVRVDHQYPSGIACLLREAWQRYQLPMAITEVHMNCGREHQLRWLKHIWDIACRLKRDGLEIKAVTAWALLGSYGWNDLLTGAMTNYEPGVFDVRNNRLRKTALAKMVRAYSSGQPYAHPLLDQPGWWETETRFIKTKAPVHMHKRSQAAPVLIVGKHGTLAAAFTKICEQRHINCIALSRSDIDAGNEKNVETIIGKIKPWAIINAAGYVQVDEAERNVEECFSVNATMPAVLAKVCQKHSLPFMTFSSDLVFNGKKNLPYTEHDVAAPLNVYGKSKAAGEKQVVQLYRSALIIRTSSFFGPWDRYNFPYMIIDALKQNKSCKVLNDVFVSPTYIPDLVNIALDLFIDEETGIWHLCNHGIVSWADLAREIADRAGCNKKKLSEKSLADMQLPAQRPLYSAMTSEKGVQLPDLSQAIGRYFNEKIF